MWARTCGGVRAGRKERGGRGGEGVILANKSLVLGTKLVAHVEVFARHDEEVHVGPKRQR
jgi:hypothetical protein